jgi:hypothetical protein
MKKVNLLLLSLFFFAAPTLARAQTEPKVVTLAQGQKAPFAGTLLNPAAVAHTIAEKEGVANQCKLTQDYLEQREKARCDLLIASVNARLDASKTTLDSILRIKDEEIERLSQVALSRPNEYSHWWFAGGVAVGIITSITIFYASVEVVN